MNNPKNIPFHTINWEEIPVTEHPGITGRALWRTQQYNGLRIRMVEYPPGYYADHWCAKGHFVHCLSGSFTSELHTGETVVLEGGASYLVSDDMSNHRSHTATGALLLIVDGDFLQFHTTEPINI